MELDPYFLLIILSTLFCTSRVHALKYLGLCSSTKWSILCLHRQKTLLSLSSSNTPQNSLLRSFLLPHLTTITLAKSQIWSHASSALIDLLPILRLNSKLILNRFATHRTHFLAPHISITPQCTIIFAEQTSDSFAVYTVTPL